MVIPLIEGIAILLKFKRNGYSLVANRMAIPRLMHYTHSILNKGYFLE